MLYNYISIRHEGNHYEVYINGDFFCSADTYYEALKEVEG